MISKSQPHRLHRSPKQRWIGGVCGGIAEYLGTEPGLVRLIAAASLFVSFGWTFLIYLVLVFALPKRSAFDCTNEQEHRFARNLDFSPADALGQLVHRQRRLNERLKALESTLVSRHFDLAREIDGLNSPSKQK